MATILEKIKPSLVVRTYQVSAADFQWSELLLLNVMFYKIRLNKVFYIEEMADRHSCHLRLSEPVGTVQGPSSALQLDSNGCIYAFNHKGLGAYFSREFSWSKAEWGSGSRFVCWADLRAPDWISWAEANCEDSPISVLPPHFLSSHTQQFASKNVHAAAQTMLRKTSLTKLRLMHYTWCMVDGIIWTEQEFLQKWKEPMTFFACGSLGNTTLPSNMTEWQTTDKSAIWWQ